MYKDKIFLLISLFSLILALVIFAKPLAPLANPSRHFANQNDYVSDRRGGARHNKTINSSMRGSFLPQVYADFKRNCQKVARHPEGAILMLFDAVYAYMNPKTRSEGSKMLRYILHEDANWERKPSRSTLVERLRNPHYSYIFRSYANGARPNNNYAMNPNNYALTIASLAQESDHVSISIISHGADSPRIFRAKQFEDGLFYLVGIAGLPGQVREPRRANRNNSHDADYD